MGVHGRLMASTTAGLAYAALVFCAGFILGTVRLFLLAPRLGATVAVLLEAPVMLALSWWICRWCVGRFRVEAARDTRLLMGVVAFLGLQLAEVALAGMVFGQPPGAYLQGLRTMPGAIGLAAQLIFASWPLVQFKLVQGRA
jgi:hypothetical protein